MSVVADILTAVRLLTIVPAGGFQGARPARYFPLVGLLFGAIAFVVARAAGLLGAGDGSGALLTGAVIVAVWAALSGGLHLDGLADSADGVGVSGDAARRLAAMRDSSVGAFGVIAIVLVVALQVPAIAMIIESQAWWALVSVPVIGRFGATAALTLRRPASAEGLAARYAERPSVSAGIVALAPVAALLALAPGTVSAGVILAGVLVALVVPSAFCGRLGGVTGDVAGATIAITETAVLVACALVAGAA